MKRIPVSRYVYEGIATSYELRCYCGEKDANIYRLNDLPDIEAGDEIILFAPGRQKQEDKKHFNELRCRIQRIHPEVVFEIIGTKPGFNELYPAKGYSRMEAAAQSL